MRQEFSSSTVNAIAEVTGLEGSELNALVGAAEITAILGKKPVWVDMGYYLGLCKPTMDAMFTIAVNKAWNSGSGPLAEWYREYASPQITPKKTAVIYSLAALLVMDGVCAGVMPESEELKQARDFLNVCVCPQMIQTYSQFAGYLLTLEYIECRKRGIALNLSNFIKGRSGGNAGIKHVREFLSLIEVENNAEFKALGIPVEQTDNAGRRLYFEFIRFNKKAVAAAM